MSAQSDSTSVASTSVATVASAGARSQRGTV